jgi:hypothetical protein
MGNFLVVRAVPSDVSRIAPHRPPAKSPPYKTETTDGCQTAIWKSEKKS